MKKTLLALSVVTLLPTHALAQQSPELQALDFLVGEWTYDELEGVPAGTTVKDASEIMPRDAIFQFADGPPDRNKFEDYSPLLRDILSRGLREARAKANAQPRPIPTAAPVTRAFLPVKSNSDSSAIASSFVF